MVCSSRFLRIDLSQNLKTYNLGLVIFIFIFITTDALAREYNRANYPYSRAAFGCASPLSKIVGCCQTNEPKHQYSYENSAVGMHQHYFDESIILPTFMAVEDIQIGQGQTMLYLVEMGISSNLMFYSFNTPPDEIYVLVEEELLETKLATKFIK